MDDLYRAIEASPEDAAPRLVLADLLQSEGDPRGTLIVAQHAVRSDPDDVPMREAVARNLRQHPELLPTDAVFESEPDLLDLRWRDGFVERMSVRLPRWVRFEEGASLEAMLRGLVDHPSCRVLRELVVMRSEALPDGLSARLGLFGRPGFERFRWSGCADEDVFVQSVLQEPASIVWADIRSDASLAVLAEHAEKLVNLEVLEYHGHAESLPEALGDLPALRRLSVSWSRRLQSLPDGLFANPSFAHLTMYDCVGLQAAGYEMLRLNQLLAGWERTHTSPRQRRVELSLQLGRDAAQASDEDLLRALDANMAAVRQGAIRVLSERLAPLRPSGEVVLAGSFDLKKAEAKALLDAVGAKVKAKIGPSTRAVLVAQSPKGLQLQALRAGLPIGLERDVLALRDAPVEAADAGVQAALRSRDPDRTLAALDALSHGVLDAALVADVLAVVHDVEMAKKVRNAAKKLFSVSASEALQVAAAAQLKQSPLASGEEKRVARIRAIEAAAPEFDGLTFSIALCERAGCAWTLIFERADDAEVRRLLSANVRDGVLDLGASGIAIFPEAMADLDVTELRLHWLGLREVPAVVGRMRGLRTLDLSENQLAALPDLSALTALAALDVSRNRFTALPDGLRTLPALHTLEISADSDTGVRMRGLPDWVGELRLRELHLRNHDFRALPDGFFALSTLRSLSVVGCRMPPPDARVAGWASLETLEVAYSDWDAHADALAAWLPDTAIRTR